MSETKKWKLYVGLPSTGWTNSAQMHVLRRIEKRYADQIEFIYPDKQVYRMLHDYARNSIVDEFLASDADILWQLDADVAPPENVLDIITEHGDKWQAAGAPYPVAMSVNDKSIREIVFTVYRGDEKGMTPTDIPMEGLDFVDGVATGCMFLKRGVFLRLERPYFAFEFDNDTRKMKVGEDLGFCIKLHKLGIKFFVDYSKTCGHVKEVDLLEVNNYAIAYAKRTIEAYMETVRSQLREQAAILAAARKPKVEVAKKPSIWMP
jgi:hypothetical protein